MQIKNQLPKLLTGTLLAGAFLASPNTAGAFAFRDLGTGSELRADLTCGAKTDSAKSKDHKCGAKKDSTKIKGKDGKCGQGKCGGAKPGKH